MNSFGNLIVSIEHIVLKDIIDDVGIFKDEKIALLIIVKNKIFLYGKKT